MKPVNTLCTTVGLIVWACMADAQVITTVVGTDWSFPPTPLLAIDAPLSQPVAVAVDASGNVYLADEGNAMVFRITPSGSLTVVAGNGVPGYSGDGGPATSASLYYNTGIAVDTAGDLYIPDRFNNIVRRVTSDGVITTIAGNGTAGFSGDGGPATSAQLFSPTRLALDHAGSLYISDANNYRIRKVAPSGTITTVAGNGRSGYSGDGGSATNASLVYPSGLAIDAVGNLYIADYNQAVRMVTPEGVIGTVSGTVIAPSYSGEQGVAVDAAGDLFFTDYYNNVVRKRTSAGVVTIVAGGKIGFSGDGGPATAARLHSPADVAVDATGELYIADLLNYRVRRVSPVGTIGTLAGNGAFHFLGDGGPAATAALNGPGGLALDTSGNLFIADYFNYRIRKVSPDGIIATVAGNGQIGASGDGGLATEASIEGPLSVAVDNFENVYIAGFYDVRRVNSSSTITTVPGFQGDAVAVDGNGNLYVENSACDCIQELWLDGTITTIAGNGQSGFSGDGGSATAAEIGFSGGLRVDGSESVYFGDDFQARKVTPDGIIRTVAGNGNVGFSGDGGPATKAGVDTVDVALDGVGNLYIADYSNDRIRKVAPDGVITTVAGNGVAGFAGDGGQATSAELNGPDGVAVDTLGNLYISDSGNNRIREVLVQAPLTQTSPTQLQFNAASGGAPTHPQQITFTASVAGLPFTIQVPNNAPWLQVTPLSGLSPRLISVSADPTNLSPGNYSATIAIDSPNGLPASSQIPVTFTVTAGVPPMLTLDNQKMSFFFPQQSHPLTQAFKVSNSGGGTLNFTATASTVADGNWLSVSPSTGHALPASPITLTVTANPSGLSPGTYSGTVTVSAPGNSSSTVPVTMTISSSDQAILLSQRGLAFLAVEQGGVVPPQSFGVVNIGTGVVSWSVSTSTLAGGDWLQVNTDSGSSDASASSVPTVQVSVNPSGLAAGQYYGLVRVDAPSAANSPQVLTVFLQVLPAGTDIGAMVQPANLLFTAKAGAESPGSQNVSVYNITAAGKSFKSSVSADSGLNLVTLPTNATLDPQHPISIVVQPFTSNLAPGVYNGAVTLEFSDGRVQSVSIQVIVTAGAPSASADATLRTTQGSPCMPTKLLPALTTLGQSFAVSAGWPVALGVNVKDDCGNPLDSGSVTATFSDGEPTLALQSLKGGYWEGTWPTSNSLAPVTVTLQAQNAQQQISGKLEVDGALQSSTNPPAFNNSQVVSAASFQPYVAVAPGGIISIFGNLLAEEIASASSIPLLTELANTDTQVFVQGRLAPLYYVSQTQINALVPYELPANTTNQQVLVQRGLTYSLPVPVNVAGAQPAIFNCGGGQGCIEAVRTAGSAPFLVTPATPAQAGDALVIYCEGLGAVTPSVTDGYPPGSQLSTIPNSAVQVTIGNQTVQPFFVGLAPGYVGLYQVQAIVPQGVPTGGTVPVTLSIQGQTSPPLTIAIQ